MSPSKDEFISIAEAFEANGLTPSARYIGALAYLGLTSDDIMRLSGVKSLRRANKHLAHVKEISPIIATTVDAGEISPVVIDKKIDEKVAPQTPHPKFPLEGKGSKVKGSKNGKNPKLSKKTTHASDNLRVKEVEDVYEHWIRETGHKPRSHGERRQLIRIRLEQGYTVEELKQAVSGCANSTWHVQNGFDDITLICRSGQKVEQFMALAKRTRPARWKLQPRELYKADEEEGEDPQL